MPSEESRDLATTLAEFKEETGDNAQQDQVAQLSARFEGELVGGLVEEVLGEVDIDEGRVGEHMIQRAEVESGRFWALRRRHTLRSQIFREHLFQLQVFNFKGVDLLHDVV